MNQTFTERDLQCGPETCNVEGLPDSAEIGRCAERLTVVTERMLAFLQTYLSRLQNIGQSMNAVAQQMAEFQKCHADWEQQKERETRRMFEDARLLSQAWDRIEAERRESLTMGNAIEMSVMEAPVDPVSSASANQPSRPSLTDTDLFDLGIPTLTQTPAMEFQQLRREIRQHSQRKR